MPLSPGTRLGQYDILAAIGSGGMGEVYRARDTRLNREVALKVLPELFVHDPERLARFEREAQLLASLNHPNIAHIYEAGRSSLPAGAGPAPASSAGSPVAFLALELVPGPTLAERIARGPIPVEEALAISRQIVDALEAAHEQGVIHRDLKPANIKVREDGTVKVLDFGLAKAMFGSPGSEDPGLHNSPTLTARGTEMGVILGTAAYMSPEQAKGKTADRRADIWAFGVVLFEMLAGKQVFTGETASEVMASVMKEDANWSLLPANLPPALLRLLRRCLEKDPKKRMSAMSDVRLELNEKDVAVAAAPPAPARASRFGLLGAAIAGALVTALGFFVAAPALRSTPVRETSRVSVLGPEGVTPLFDAAESAISPDGRALVFTMSDPNGATRLWIRPLDALNAKVLDGTESGHMPFWSPDSKHIGFFSTNKLKKMPAAGGTVEVLCDAPDGRGGAWGSGNIIVFAPASSGPLLQISANGGDTKPATTLDAAKGETGHRFPSFLPDGRHFLFAALPAKNLQFDLFVGSVDDASRVALPAAESAAVYAEPGYLLFARRGTLIAQPFNPSSLKLSGEPVGVSDAASSTAGLYSSGRAVSVSSNGTMAYLGDRLPNTKLVWLDRNGRQIGTLAAPEGRYQEVTIAPDGRRASIVRFTTQNDSDIWIVDLARAAATRFTTERGLNMEATWSPDSERVVFASDVPGRRTLFVKPSSGATPEKTFYESAALFKDPHSWSSDGKYVAFEQLDPKTNRDIMYVPADGTANATPTAYLQTPFNETLPSFSPNAKWMAYVSDESGHNEVYIDSFPTPRNKLKVTESGATLPFWSKDGRELLTVSSNGKSVFAADVTESAGAISTSQPRKLFDLSKAVAALGVTPDHQRLLAALDITDNTTSTLTVVFNWIAAIKQK